MLVGKVVIVLGLAVGLSACSDPSCEEVIKHLTARLGPTDSDKMKQCKEDPWSGELRACMLKVMTEQDFSQCIFRYRGFRYMKKSDDVAREALERLGKALKVHYLTDATFPTTSAPLTPATSCCDLGSGAVGFKCQPDPALWTAAPWSDLGFSVDEPTPFRYAYDVIDPLREVVVRAVSDADCDTTEATASLRATVVNGDVTTEYIKPPTSD